MKRARAILVCLSVALLATACTAAVVAPAHVPTATPDPNVDAHPVEPARPPETTLFVTSEDTNAVSVLRGDPLPKLVASVPTATDPHNLGLSPDGKWVAAGDRMASFVSVIDTSTSKEVARVAVGRQPHDLQWHPGGQVLFVSQERENFISRIEVGTWRLLPPLQVGTPQHDLAIWPGRPDELWFTITNTSQAKTVRVYHLDTDKLELLEVDDSHDVFFTPDGTEAWMTSSGFPNTPSDRIVTFDAMTKKVTSVFRLGAGHYPFHSLKRGRDGIHFPERTDLLFLTDRLRKALLVVDVKSHAIVKEIPLGLEPFHMTWAPNERLYVSNSGDSTVTVIDTEHLTVVTTLPVPKRPHGIAVLYR